MIKTFIRKNILPLIFLSLSVIIAVYYNNRLPNIIVTHWDMQGNPNDYTSRAFGLFIIPLISLFSFAGLHFLPKLDPYKKNFSQFEQYYRQFVIFILGFFLYLQLITCLWNYYQNFNLISFLVPSFTAIYYYIGFLLSKTKRNWFVGIRTPWTMESDLVWHKVHQLGSVLFKISALIGLLGLFFPKLAFFFIIIPLLSSTFFLFVYSYYIYQKNHH